MRHLCAFVFIVLLAVMPSCKFFKSKGLFGKKSENLALMLARQDSIRVADSLRKAQERLAALETARLDSIRIAEEKKIPTEVKGRYNIIVGSFYTPEYATALAEEYRQKGYDARIIKMDGSRFELVSAESYDSFRTAVAHLKEFKNTILTDAWMYIKN